jgi:hypothetical protein
MDFFVKLTEFKIKSLIYSTAYTEQIYYQTKV